MRVLLRELEQQLDQIRAQDHYRHLAPPCGLDYSSNDYLGLSQDPAFRRELLRRLEQTGHQRPLFSPASRLLRGTTTEHGKLERRLAAFKGTESALIFPTGYQANIGVLTALLTPQDRVLSDAQNHASIIDGVRLSGCQKVIYPHLDSNRVERELARPHHGGRTLLVTESLFSMDGDVAPLEAYADLADRHGAALVVDDAHAIGVFGDRRGSGLVESLGLERRCAVTISTFGKALGLSGAFVAGPAVMIDYLVNRCRSFIFTTAVPPLLLHGVETALDMVQDQPERRKRVLGLADRLRQRLGDAGLNTLASSGPIVPVVLGESRRALRVAEKLQREGLDVRAVRPPTVAPGTERLRISVHADHTEKGIDHLARLLIAAVGENPPEAGLDKEN